MSIIGRFLGITKRFITDPVIRQSYLATLGFYDNTDDRKYIERVYKLKLGYKPDLDNPKTFCEKMNWLKLYDRRPIYTTMVDKYLAKEFVSEKVGKEYVTPLLGVYDSYDEIDFSALPDQFVMKCNHDGGPVFIKDKRKIDHKELRRLFKRKLKLNYFALSREWPYKNVKRKIVIEEFVPSLGKRDSIEYSITCFNGKVAMITRSMGIAHDSLDKRNSDHFDMNWNRLDFYSYYRNSGVDIPKPDNIDKLIELSESLAEGVPCLRVDWFMFNEEIRFGEMTFFDCGGFIEFTPPEWDAIIGGWLELPEKYNE